MSDSQKLKLYLDGKSVEVFAIDSGAWISQGWGKDPETASKPAIPAKPPEPPRNAEGLRLDGPTLEMHVAAGYPADKYPPEGYASKPSPGLTVYLEERAKASTPAPVAETAKAEDLPAVPPIEAPAAKAPEKPGKGKAG